MNNELTFRILLLFLFIAFVAHRAYYNRKLPPSKENTLKEREGKCVPIGVHLLSILALFAVVIYIIYPKWMTWSSLPFPTSLRWVGVGLAVLGFFLLQWAHQALGNNWSDTPRLIKAQTLVTNGPYRWVRHPIYTAFLLIMSATLFLSANWFIGSMWIGMTIVEVISRMSIEEAMLMEHFGDQYRVYRKRTGRLLPRLIRSSKEGP